MEKDRSIDTIALEAFTIVEQQQNNSILTTLLTTKEKVVLGRRLLIAQAIMAGKTRMEINELIRISPNTFAQINRWLKSEKQTYTSALHPSKRRRKHLPQRAEPFSYEDMKRRYPAHFLLFTLVEELWKQK